RVAVGDELVEHGVLWIEVEDWRSAEVLDRQLNAYPAGTNEIGERTGGAIRQSLSIAPRCLSYVRREQLIESTDPCGDALLIRGGRLGDQARLIKEQAHRIDVISVALLVWKASC